MRHFLEDQTREFLNMSETKIRAFRMSESAHAKLVEGVEHLELFTGVGSAK